MSGLIAPDGSEAFSELERVWIGAGDTSVFTGRLEPIRDRVVPVSEKVAINDWITAIPTPGHTPGHTVYDVRSGTAHLLVWGDTVHVPTLQFDQPNVSWELDGNQSQARAARAALLEQLTQPHHVVAGAHLDSSGIARITPPATVMRWNTSHHRSADRACQLRATLTMAAKEGKLVWPGWASTNSTTRTAASPPAAYATASTPAHPGRGIPWLRPAVDPRAPPGDLIKRNGWRKLPRTTSSRKYTPVVTSENPVPARSQPPPATSENTDSAKPRRRGARPTPLLAAYEHLLADYTASLEQVPLAADTRRTAVEQVIHVPR
ncbi:hypothetical protein [Nonomuraea aurantiaca]|uniref:hypothetical protein n=1 Tax=Nonomuraea aurantiaca TaxID=2878562 RepID=UPI001CD9ED9C|nr:hypothetical protein [Nonomuraea aurantiaca]MCA2230471.1 hypothetical protein [Nonomuraea aurantiaca]